MKKLKLVEDSAEFLIKLLKNIAFPPSSSVAFLSSTINRKCSLRRQPSAPNNSIFAGTIAFQLCQSRFEFFDLVERAHGHVLDRFVLFA